MQILGVIPARYASTRFPGKPLVDIKGKTMIQRVYEQVQLALNYVVVATDDDRIKECVRNFGGNVVMTAKNHQSGTDRCAEALALFEKEIKEHFDAVINIQGDEPFIEPSQINQIANLLSKEGANIATLIKPIEENAPLFNPNKVKVIINNKNEAIYFSRQPIPYLRGVNENEWHIKHTYFQHIGMYGYKKDTLMQITELEKGKLELAESLEQLRWLENKISITTAQTRIEGICIDTPEDLEKVLNLLD